MPVCEKAIVSIQITIGNDFWITNDKRENFGKVEQRILSMGKKFEYFDL